MSSKVYIIAEIGVNHNGSVELAKEMIIAAAKAGADAVKFQTFISERSVTAIAPKAEYQKEKTLATNTQLEMLKSLEMPFEAYRELIDTCAEYGVDFLTTPSDYESLDFIMEIKPDIKWLKVSSGDVTNAPLLLKIAQTGKPVIFSTGMATIGEIELALGTLAFGYMHKDEQPSGIADIKSAYNSLAGQEILKRKIILLHCTTQYPTNPQDVNLKAMDTLKDIFDFPVGYSDHTQGGAISVAAVARGSVVIEKHFTTSHQLPGPDQAASMEPQLFKQMVEDIRKVEIALGSGRKLPTAVELQNSPVVRKSIVADRLIFKGQEFSEENIIPKSPEGGISPFYYWDLLGKCAKRDYANDEMIDFHIE